MVPAIRLIILASVVIVVLATVGALAPTAEREPERPVGAPPSSAAGDRPTGTTVTAKLPSKEPIEASVGDTVVLELAPPERAEVLEIKSLFVREYLSADQPRTLRVLPFRPGTFRVRLLEEDETIGRIVVGPRRATPPPGRSTPDATPAPGDPTPASVLPRP